MKSERNTPDSGSCAGKSEDKGEAEVAAKTEKVTETNKAELGELFEGILYSPILKTHSLCASLPHRLRPNQLSAT